MSSHQNDIFAALFSRTPSSSTGLHHSTSQPRPLIHSKSVAGESSSQASQPTTPRARPNQKRVPRRSTSSLCAASPPSLATFYNSSYGGNMQNTPRRSLNSSPFAGSKFADSPSARAIPLPPVSWFEDEEEDSLLSASLGAAPSSDTESLTSSDSLSSSGTLASSASLGSSGSASPPVGVRINPLHLIAAVSAS